MGQVLHQEHVAQCRECQSTGCCGTGEKLKHVPDPGHEEVIGEADLEGVDHQTILPDDVGSLEDVLGTVTTNECGAESAIEIPEGEAKVIVVNEGMTQEEDV